MKREIKFRAWDKEGGEMFNPETENNSETFFTGFKDGMLVCEDENGDDYPVMQFTGLLDKNGKEIYEGDVVKPSVALDNDFIYPVVFPQMFNLIGENHEVIGNIYEHPHLIKTK